MQIILDLPDDVVAQLAPGHDVSRAALEALVADAVRSGRLSESQAAKVLGLDRYELDGLLKLHRVWLDYSAEDVQQESALGDALLRRDISEQPGPQGG